MTRSFLLTLPAILLAASITEAANPPPDIDTAIKAIQSVSRDGAGNEAAAAGWKRLAAAGPGTILPVLAALDTADPVAANWLRSAIDAIAEGAKKRKQPLPAADLEAFVKDTKRSTVGRRIAFELYAAEAKEAAAKLLPTLIDDPSADIRRDAIEARIKAPPAEGAARKAELKTLFTAARDQDQVEDLAKKLEAAGEKKPNLTEHFGFV